MSQNKMPPDRYSQMIKHLTRKKIKNPFIPASAIQRPKKILEIEFNRKVYVLSVKLYWFYSLIFD